MRTYEILKGLLIGAMPKNFKNQFNADTHHARIDFMTDANRAQTRARHDLGLLWLR